MVLTEALKIDGLFIKIKLSGNKYLRFISERSLENRADLLKDFTAVLDAKYKNVANINKTTDVIEIHLHSNTAAIKGIFSSVAKALKKSSPTADGFHPADTEPAIRNHAPFL